MKPYGSKRSHDTEPRMKAGRALVKREGEAEIEAVDYSPEEAAADPATCRKPCCASTIDLGDGVLLTQEQAASRRAADERIGKLARDLARDEAANPHIFSDADD